MTGESAEPAETLESAEVGLARRRLARAQTQLLAALLGGAPPPAEFDPAPTASPGRRAAGQAP